MGRIEVDKIVVEVSSRNGETIETHYIYPEQTKITLVIDGKNISLYEGKEFKSYVP